MLGEIISAGANLLGGLFGKSSTEKANERNIQLQKEFAQNGIAWKVADAKRAGIHPLAALGASTVSFSPSVVGDTSLSEGVSNMGQDIGRAINATSTQAQRDRGIQAQIANETLRGLRLDNEGKAISNTALASQTVLRSQVGPPLQSADGSSNTGLPGQSSSKINIGTQAMPSFPGSPASDTENAFGEGVGDASGWLNFRDSVYKMTPNQQLGLLQSVFPGFQWDAMKVPRFTPNAAGYGSNRLPRRSGGGGW